eukprot:8102585-Prorocentrum_lima.AAC.1
MCIRDRDDIDIDDGYMPPREPTPPAPLRECSRSRGGPLVCELSRSRVGDTRCGKDPALEMTNRMMILTMIRR